MKWVLWIDDEPRRFVLLTGDWTDVTVVFACGALQIDHYLNASGIKWDLILLDHDMGDHINGMKVCQKFLAERNFPVVCVSMNTPKRKKMVEYLQEWEVPAYDIPVTDKQFAQKIRSLL
jgi:beta-lactamase superfamily II metal-dependent hydrolase